jgi:hypothetical protein
MLEAAGRSPVRASHLHFMVTAPRLRTLVTHIFVEGDPQIEIGDSVFGVKESLIKRFETQPAGAATPDGSDLGNTAWARTCFDVVLAPAEISGGAEGRGVCTVHTQFWLGGHVWTLSPPLWTDIRPQALPSRRQKEANRGEKSSRNFPLVMSSPQRRDMNRWRPTTATKRLERRPDHPRSQQAEAPAATALNPPPTPLHRSTAQSGRYTARSDA